MHSLETINRLNNQSHENWTAEQEKECNDKILKTEYQNKSFLVFFINQALGLANANSNSEVSALLKVALGLVEKPEKA